MTFVSTMIFSGRRKLGMRLESSLAVPILLMGLPTQAQSNSFKAAYDANQVFVLRDAMERSRTPLFYRAAVDASLKTILQLRKGSPYRNPKRLALQGCLQTHDLLGNMYFRNGMYREGFNEVVAALQERPNSSDAKSMLPILTALNQIPEDNFQGLEA